MSSQFRTLCTLWLLALILSPFNSPFPTCALRHLFADDADRAAAMLIPPPSAEAGAADDAKAAMYVTAVIRFSPRAIVGVGRRVAPPPHAVAQQLSFMVIRV